MIRPRTLLAYSVSIAILLSFVPTGLATAPNTGTVKVHDNEEENPAQRNVPHVDCDFWVEGFGMNDDSGWLVFFAWPPTGDFEMVDSGEDQDWTADAGDVAGEFHFLAGPFTLESGHYRVEVYTDEGHPGADDHFAKSKTFWVECEDTPVVNPPCPPGLELVAASADGEATITLSWDAVADADSYVVYRADAGGDFEAIEVVVDGTTYVDTEVTAGVTYEYYVTAVIGNFESVNCESVEGTAIPFFPNAAVGVLAALGAVAAFVVMRRKL